MTKVKSGSNSARTKSGGKPVKGGKPAKAKVKAATPAVRVKMPAKLQEAVNQDRALTPSEKKLAKTWLIEQYGQDAWDLREDINRLETSNNSRTLSNRHQVGQILAKAAEKYSRKGVDVIAIDTGFSRSYAYGLIRFAQKVTPPMLKDLLKAMAEGKVANVSLTTLSRLFTLVPDDGLDKAWQQLCGGTATLDALLVKLQAGHEKTRAGRSPSIPDQALPLFLAVGQAGTKFNNLISTAFKNKEEILGKIDAVSEDDAPKLARQLGECRRIMIGILEKLQDDYETVEEVERVLAERFGTQIESLSPAPAALPGPKASDDDEEDEEEPEDDELQDAADEDEDTDDEEEEEEEDADASDADDSDTDDDEDEEEEDDDFDDDDDDDDEPEPPLPGGRVRRI